MKNNTTDTRSGNKRRNVFLHYTSAILVLTLTTSIPNTPVFAANAATISTVSSPENAITARVPSADPFSGLFPVAKFSLREVTLQMQVDSLEEDLAKEESRVDEKIAEIDAEFEKYETVDALITKLHKYVGKSPYVLSGVGPTGWDCSGLVMWFYKQYKGYYLEHRASAQANGGEKVDAPIPGDIVAFTYNGSKSAYHVGIYVGGGYMIHAKNRGEDTVLELVNKFAGKNSKVAYIRY